MRVAIMQPYLFPYIGYFQLINAVDQFIIYDNIEYTKKGWINRNRILQNGTDKLFTIPLKKDSDYLDVADRYIAEGAQTEINKLLNQIKINYINAPFFKESYPVIQNILSNQERNLFRFIINSVQIVCEYLGIDTKIIVSSQLGLQDRFKGEERVISICKHLNADDYINAIGGIDLYNKTRFSENGINLFFIKSEPIIYPQFKNEFIPNLSIIDVMMFNNRQNISDYLTRYTLI